MWTPRRPPRLGSVLRTRGLCPYRNPRYRPQRPISGVLPGFPVTPLAQPSCLGWPFGRVDDEVLAMLGQIALHGEDSVWRQWAAEAGRDR